MGEDVIGGRVSLVAEDGERENFHRSVRALPAARGHAGRITCRYDIAGHSLNSRLCRVPEVGAPPVAADVASMLLLGGQIEVGISPPVPTEPTPPRFGSGPVGEFRYEDSLKGDE